MLTPISLHKPLFVAAAIATMLAGSAFAAERAPRLEPTNPAYGAERAPQMERTGPVVEREPKPEPRGYSYTGVPEKMHERPGHVDRDFYRHDFRSRHHHRIGPFFGGPDWTDEDLELGEEVPEFYRTGDRYIGDYWLFGLEVPPVGFEWIRWGRDALLVDVTSGEVLQAVRDVFA